MTNMALSSNLQQLMKIHGNISISNLARLSKLPQPTLHHILSGSTKNPRRNALEALAKFFNISIEQLIGKSGLPNIIPDAIKDSLKIRTIPIIEWDMAKNWPIDNIKELHLKEMLIEKDLANHSFAIIMENATMEPLFPVGAILIFDFGENPKDRDFVIVHLGRIDSIVFNRLFIDGKDRYIKQDFQDGNAHLTKLKAGSDRIIAKLTEVRIPF